MAASAAPVKKVVLAYSGGLDSSIILKWLQQTYGCEVVTVTADLGQGEELAPAREKALMLGIKPENIFIEDLREEFVRDYVFPMFRANALYEGQYLLGTSIARPLIAKKQIEIAEKVGADAVAHGFIYRWPRTRLTDEQIERAIEHVVLPVHAPIERGVERLRGRRAGP